MEHFANPAKKIQIKIILYKKLRLFYLKKKILKKFEIFFWKIEEHQEMEFLMDPRIKTEVEYEISR